MLIKDPEALGCFVQYRAAFYIAGGQDSLLNFFMLMDGYFQHRSKQLARATPFEVHIYPYIDVDLNGLSETMSYTPVTQHPQSRSLPLKLFEAHPVVGKKVLCFFFEAESDYELSLVITGNTWNFRDDLERVGVQGARADGGGYYRYIKTADLTNEESRQQILGLVDIFHKQAIRVVVDPTPEPGSPVEKFLDDMRAMHCLHFV